MIAKILNASSVTVLILDLKGILDIIWLRSLLFYMQKKLRPTRDEQLIIGLK